jgi:hypothetical protein
MHYSHPERGTCNRAEYVYQTFRQAATPSRDKHLMIFIKESPSTRSDQRQSDNYQ